MLQSIKHILFDANDPQALAQFWSKATGLKVANDYGGFLTLESKPGWPTIAFYKVDEPKSIKNRQHLDFKVENEAVESERLVKLGAKVESEQKNGDFSWRVMLDPEGNEFCISAQW